MKFFKMIAAILLPVLALSFIQSCSSDNGVTNTDTPSGIEAFNVYDYNFSVVGVSDATLESDYSLDDCMPMNPIDDNNKGGKDGGKDDKKNPHVDKKNPLGRIFRDLNLTEDQKAQIKELMKGHILCEMQWFDKLKAAREEAMVGFKEARQAIVDQVKSGAITREEGKAQLKVLNQELRDKLANLPINEEVRAGIILCREEFLAAIGLILTPEQKLIWDDFVAKIRKV